jgi:hypothetical protein
MYLSGHQYSCPDVFKFPLDLIAGKGHRLALFLPLSIEGGRTPEYWGGLEGRAEGGAVGVGFSLIGAFLVLLSMFILCLTKNDQHLSA